MSEKQLVQAEFINTVRFGRAGIPMNRLSTRNGVYKSDMQVDSSDVKISLVSDDRFLKVEVVNSGLVQLVPMSNVSSFILDLGK